MMGCLSRNIFRLHASDRKMSNVFIRTYNSQIYHNPYAGNGALRVVGNKYFYSPERGKNLEMVRKTIEGTTSMELAHGNIIMSELFDDPDRFMPVTLQFIIKLYEHGPKVINNNLIKQVLELYNFPNTTHYYLASKYKVLRMFAVSKGMYSFLTYR